MFIHCGPIIHMSNSPPNPLRRHKAKCSVKLKRKKKDKRRNEEQKKEKRQRRLKALNRAHVERRASALSTPEKTAFPSGETRVYGPTENDEHRLTYRTYREKRVVGDPVGTLG